MIFKCGCNFRVKMVGDGCPLCNTARALDLMPQPEEIAEELANNGFSEDQATHVAEEIFQPLMSLISTLNDKIDQIAKAVK